MNTIKSTQKVSETRWLAILIFILVSLATLYVVLHARLAGSEAKRITTYQLGVINSLATDITEGKLDTTTCKQKIRLFLQTTLYPDYPSESYCQSQCDSLTRDGNTQPLLMFCDRCEKSPAYSNQLSFLNTYDLRTIGQMLPHHEFKVPSYFWLYGEKVYLEIIFWSLFGVLASILYSSSEAIFIKEFDYSRIPRYIAQLFYAPFSTLVVHLSFSLFTTADNQSFNAISTNAIILAFILGFFTRRTVELLHRLRDVIIPGTLSSSSNDTGEQLHDVNGSLSIAGVTTLELNDLALTTVRLTSSEDPTAAFVTQADKFGKFTFPNVPSGNYDLFAEFRDDRNKKYYTGTASVKLDKNGLDDIVQIELSETDARFDPKDE